MQAIFSREPKKLQQKPMKIYIFHYTVKHFKNLMIKKYLKEIKVNI